EAGAVPQADMIRAMLEQAAIDHQLLLLRRQRGVAITRLLPLLGLPSDSPVPSFGLSHEMPSETAMDATLPETTPAIAELQAEVSRADQDLLLARLATKPDFNIEASYGARFPETDMFSIVGRIELPFRRSAIIEPRIREAVARREAAQQQIELLRLQLRQDLGAAALLREEAIEQIRLHVDKLMPIARLGFESSLSSYQTGKSTFDAVLDSLRTDIALNVDYYDFLRQRLKAEVEIRAIRKGARSGRSGADSMSTSPPSMTPSVQSGDARQ
ncbi:MAG: TolC family protein, partial [Acidobacteriota bacterium]